MVVEYSKTTTLYHARIRYFTSPSLHRAVVEVERPGEVNSAIGGGEDNVIGGAAQQHSFIGGGHDNAVSGACAAIIGGSGNVATHAWATVTGQNVASAKACAIHSNFAIFPNMPALGGVGALPRELQIVADPAVLGFPAGTFLVVTT